MIGCLAAPLVATAENGGTYSSEKNVQLSRIEQQILDANNAFGFKLLRTLTADQAIENTVISPVSISMALGMTLNGSESTTYDSMRAVSGFQDFTRDEINQSYRNLIDLLLSLDPDVTMEIANSIWISNDYSVKQSFRDVNRTNFGATIQTLDFSLSSTADVINGWVADKTHDRITSVVGRINPLAPASLARA